MHEKGEHMDRGGARGVSGSPPSGCVSPPPSGKNLTPVGELFMKNFALILRKVPFILLYSPLSGNLAPPSGKSWRNPCTWSTENHNLLHSRLCMRANYCHSVNPGIVSRNLFHTLSHIISFDKQVFLLRNHYNI